MTSYNIAVTVGPNIFRPKADVQEDIVSVGVYYDAMIKMIENTEALFGGDIESFENLKQGALGTEKISNLKNLLHNNRVSFKDVEEDQSHRNSMVSNCESVFTDGDIFEQMA